MYETTKEIIEACKVNEEAFEILLNKFQPLISKYAKYFGQNEKEDVEQELRIALCEGARKITNMDCEGAVTNYLIQTIKHRFGQLYKKHIQKKEIEEPRKEDFDLPYKETSYENIIFFLDLCKKLDRCTEKQRFIIREILINDASDAEIAKQLGVSKQYVNRIKKNIL